jgi:hypothetical protein
MKIHVCSNLNQVGGTARTIPVWEFAKQLGHTVTVSPASIPRERPDAIVVMGASVVGIAMDTVRAFIDTPLFVYNWDCYRWCWENPRPNEYDYQTYYKKLLPHAREIWAPSACTIKQMEACWSLSGRVIRCSVPYWDYANVRDDGYALCCLRPIPDPAWGVFEQCCDELGIPYKLPRHKLNYGEYQDVVAGCRFICAPLRELSTGGLSIVEAYYLGKPVLLSDSEWNGGRDYMAEHAEYFKHDDNADFKQKLEEMHKFPLHPDRWLAKGYVERNFSEERMVTDILTRIEVHLGG